MFNPDQYELIDFGHGRKLERFAGWTIERPCPAAEAFRPMVPEMWADVDARFDRADNAQGSEGPGGWTLHSDLPEAWTIRHGTFQIELHRSPIGHLGVFPEQASNWDWIAEQIVQKAEATTVRPDEPYVPSPLKILNLFAYTGGSTLATAVAGRAAGVEIEVVHVDSAANTIERGRRNAELSGLADVPIRWITEDAVKFARRELKRGNGYDAVILDPPSYGHGRRGEVWQASKHLPELLSICAELTADRRLFLLLTCHTPGLDEKRLSGLVREAIGDRSARIESGPMGIEAISGRTLPCGVFVRVF